MPVAEKPQHLRALDLANEFRLGRATIKRQIAASEIGVAEILDPAADLPQCIQSMTLFELLCAQRRWGPVRARRVVLYPLQISETCRLGALTPRRRERVAAALAPAEEGMS